MVVCHRAQYFFHSFSVFSLMPFSASWRLAIWVTTLSTKFKKIWKKILKCQECLLFLAINKKRSWQTLSSVDNSTISMFSSIRSYRKINKLHERSLRLCHNIKPRAMMNFWASKVKLNIQIRNIQQLMIGIFKCVKDLSPHIMNAIFILREIPYAIRNPRSIVSCQRPCIADLKL